MAKPTDPPTPTQPPAGNGLEERLAALEKRLGAPAPAAAPCVIEGMNTIVAGDTTWQIRDFTLDRTAGTLTIRIAQP